MADDPSKGTQISATVEVDWLGRGRGRYEARPVKMLVAGTSVPFQVEDFISYGWTRRGARKRCVRKVISYLKTWAKELEK